MWSHAQTAETRPLLLLLLLFRPGNEATHSYTKWRPHTLAFSKWSQTSRQPAIAEGSKRLSMPLVTCHMFTSLRKSLVSWATILVTWGEIAPPFKSLNQIAECNNYTIMIIFWTKTMALLLHTSIKHLQTIVCTILQRFHQSLEWTTILCTDHIPCDMKCHSDPQTLLLLSRRVWGQTSTTFTQ